MGRRLSIAIVATVILGCGGATCLYSGAGPMAAANQFEANRWQPVLAAIADLLTVPIPTAEISDVRDVVQPAALGAMLLLLAYSLATRKAGWPSAVAGRFIIVAATAVGAFACISALAGGAWWLSAGWVARFACGAAWAAIIAKTFSLGMTRAAIAGLLVVGLLSMILAVAHRADRGLAHFDWPIGPITITSALVGVWAAAAGGFAVASLCLGADRQLALAALPLCVLGLYVIEETHRRSAWVGMTAAGFVVISAMLLRRINRQAAKVGVAASLALGVAALSVFVAREAARPERERAGPVQLRLTYLRLSGGMFLDHPFLGVGPDQFIVEMTNAMAPLRAVSPHVYHGDVDPCAHNEWAQAAVELGLPAALLYAALPAGVIAMALRRVVGGRRASGHSSAPHDAALMVCLVAGLVAICTIETAGITLRGPIMPIWYWTLLGLLGAAHDHAGPISKPLVGASKRGLAKAAMVALAGLSSLWLSTAEMMASADRARDGGKGHISWRLFSEKTIADQYAAATAASEIARAEPTEIRIGRAEELWRDFAHRLPVYRDAAAWYAEALIRQGRGEEADDFLESVLRDSPYLPGANAVLASLLGDDSVGRLRCVQRALRSSGWNDVFGGILDESLKHPECSSLLDAELPRARLAAVGDDDSLLRDETVELLRIRARASQAAGRQSEAIADQNLAAECYRRLERTGHPYRRPHDAETDAFFTLAALLHEDGPARYRAAYEAVRQAERYAVLGIRHEYVARPLPDYGFVGGVVIPTEFPERLYPLWRLSAYLHIMAGDERDIFMRVCAGRPMNEWTPGRVYAEIAVLAHKAHEELGRLPPEDRPDHYEELARMAERYRQAAQSPNPPEALYAGEEQIVRPTSRPN